jgi:hypothetical protein
MRVCLIMQLSLMVTHKHVQQLRITVFSNGMSCSLLYMTASQMKMSEVTQKLKLYCMRSKAKQAISLSLKYILCKADLAMQASWLQQAVQRWLLYQKNAQRRNNILSFVSWLMRATNPPQSTPKLSCSMVMCAYSCKRCTYGAEV